MHDLATTVPHFFEKLFSFYRDEKTALLEYRVQLAKSEF